MLFIQGELNGSFAQLQNKILENEGDVATYSAFTLDKYYPAELGLYKRNILKLTGFRRRDLHRVVNISLEYLNLNLKSSNRYTREHFMIGFFRSTHTDGHEYELYFRVNDGQNCCTYLKFNRPLTDHLKLIDQSLAHESAVVDDETSIFKKDDLLEVVDQQSSSSNNASQARSSKKVVNVIVPLSESLIGVKSGTSSSIQRFLSLFERVATSQDVTLTLVLSYSDQELKNRLEVMINEFKHRTGLTSLKLILVKSYQFSRARLLQIGVENLASTDNKNNSLVFLCDLDIVFNQAFLDLCRQNAISGKRVFFPIVYSLYNPVFPHSFTGYSTVDSPYDLLRINNKDSGFWRDTGFGMVCLYRQDFESVGGFGHYAVSETGTGWGGEDLYLYRRMLKTDLEIFRSVVPGLFHLYHGKECVRSRLTSSQYKNCLSMKIFGETSQKKFGQVFFKSDDPVTAAPLKQF